MIEEYLNLALEEAKMGVKNEDGGPFGAIIVDSDGNILSRGHNMVLKTNDPTCHAEIVAIRNACQKMNSFDLKGCTIYSSCEPCPMCLSAIIWAGIDKVYFGATRIDAANAGFKDDAIYEYLDGKKGLVNLTKIESIECEKVLNNYKGELY